MNQSTPNHEAKIDDLNTSIIDNQYLVEQQAKAEDKTFRDHQNKQWDEAFDELLQYRKRYGNCQVPHGFSEGPSLARWVKRQRYQYKLMKNGKPCTINEERIRRLEAISFVWESHNTVWDERISQVRQFKAQYGNAPIPKTCKRDLKLANWIKQQRRQYTLFCQGRPSTITLERIEQLQSLGFEWCRRRR
jgi:Helicase associated domain